MGLNSLLDRCNSVFLPNGETVQRHPDMVIVVTTNNDYAGCKPLNQSVLSRMSMLIDLIEPDEETLVERVLGITGCKEKKTVQTMARIVHSISEYCRENLITDGCCGVRELISWVQSYMVCGDIRGGRPITPSCLLLRQMPSAVRRLRKAVWILSCHPEKRGGKPVGKSPLTEPEMYALLAKNLSYLRKSQGGLSQRAGGTDLSTCRQKPL